MTTAWERFPLAELRGLSSPDRAALRRLGVATCGRLVAAAGRPGDRARLAREAGVPPGALLALVLRADLARVRGVGAVFGLMLEDLGVRDAADLAAREAGELHARLAEHNREERLARRSPTPGEVAGWIARARELARLAAWRDEGRRQGAAATGCRQAVNFTVDRRL